MEGRRKEVMLLILAVVALGVAVWTFRGKPAPPPPAAVAKADGEAKPGDDGKQAQDTTPEAPVGQGSQAGGVTAGAAPAGQQRNPFATPGGGEGAPVAAAPSGAAKPPAGEQPAATGPITGPGQPVTGTPPLPEGSEGSKLTLSGVVEGKPTVAILRQDDKRFFVKVGDQVGDGYRVQSIRGQQVVLVSAQGKLVLRMGGRQ
jgi:hypothetical protein